MIETHYSRDFRELPADVQASTRAFLDYAELASPFQDPVFCGDGGFGDGIDHATIVVRRNSATVFFAHCVQNYAASRYLPGLRNLHVPKGPVVEDAHAFSDGLAALQELSRSERVIEAHIEPQLVGARYDWFEGLSADLNWQNVSTVQRATLRLDLSCPLDELMANLNKTTRYEIRRASRSGLLARQAETESEFAAFYDIYDRRGREKGFSTAGPALFQNLSDRIIAAKDRGALFLSELNGRIVGGAVFLRAGRRLHYLYGASAIEVAPALPLSYPPIWRAIGWAKEIGCQEFDFGGFGPEGEAGVRRFKQGFGGDLVTFVRPKKRKFRSGSSVIARARRLLAR